MRGDRKKQQELVDEDCEQHGSNSEVITIKSFRPKLIPQLVWRECIKKVWEADPLICPKCAGEIRVISFIYQHKVIRKILEYLKKYEEKPQRAPPMKEVLKKNVGLEPFDDDWPGYEEPVFEM